ncbi:MAG TPA: hypothetical protein VHU44_13495 [Acidobacteriaceae bacterium]|jgi:hypothetical protein|nr:hypothetical protein [Acidobacteriaceae bacterium]
MKRVWDVCGVALLAMGFGVGAFAQPRPPVPLPDVSKTADNQAPHRSRLILKDGSYQLVMSYTVKGKVVSYVSAERGEREELPADLVDWDATHKWEKQHTLTADGEAPPPEIDPELLKEEADRRALTPEVAPDLDLPDQVAVVGLDYYQGTPELVPLVQSDGELNRVTGHSILKLSINPRSASHEILSLKGVESAVQMHVAQPAIYLRVGDDAGISRGSAPITVDTHGANVGEKPNSGTPPQTNEYVLVRADIRTDARVLASFNINSLGTSRPQRDVVETTSELLPGGHWMKITPKQPLDFGEYALMEVLSDRDVNSAVWDFGVHPVAPENRDVMKPQPRRPVTLEHR